jgi:hypothetical protein
MTGPKSRCRERQQKENKIFEKGNKNITQKTPPAIYDN